MVTASADKLIKLWKGRSCTHTLSGHTDAVRSLAVISSTEFLSAGNDASVRRWSSSGDCIGTYYGHGNCIYSIALLGGGSWVTSGEDRSVKVWKDNVVAQTIYLPAIYVWSVAALANGDIAAATSDGCVRVFTCDPARQASKEVQEIFETELLKVALAAQQDLGGVKVIELPGLEAQYKPGGRDGQQKMARTGYAASDHSWNMANKNWDMVGDVVGAAGGSTENSGKKLYMGKVYDFVFDIEIDKPLVSLKLPYNTTDSPFMAAQQFIHKHNLSQYYMEEIVQHIITHSGGQKLGAETGGSSYSAGPLQGGGGAPAVIGGAASGFYDPPFGGGVVSGSAGVGMRQGAGCKRPWMEDHPTTAIFRVSKRLGYKPPKFLTIESKRVGGAPAKSTVHLLFHQKIYEGQYNFIQPRA